MENERLAAIEFEIGVLQAQHAARGVLLRALLDSCTSGVILDALQRLQELHDRVLPSTLSDAALQAIQDEAAEVRKALAVAEARQASTR